MNKPSKRSLANLRGVHPELVAVTRLAMRNSEVDFVVTEGLRSKERQATLVAKGASQTMKSRHLTGHAVDVAALVGGAVSWKQQDYQPIAKAFKEAAEYLGVEIKWGGDWKSFVDMPHFELDRSKYL